MSNSIYQQKSELEYIMDQRKAWSSTWIIILSFALTACGGGGGNSSSTTPLYTLGGAINGLTASGLVLSEETQTVSPSPDATSFIFPNSLTSGATYTVKVNANPMGLNCSVSNGSGTMPANNVNNVNVMCTPLAYALGGPISGLTATGLVLTNGADSISPQANTTIFIFPNSLKFGSSYNVAVQTQPIGLKCTVLNANGVITSNNAPNISASCISVETLLYSFTSWQTGGDGAAPTGGLIEGNDGSLYGMTNNGGIAYSGTIFKISTTGVETLLRSFMGSTNDGATPYSGLIQANDGNLYGMTYGGGSQGYGTVFKTSTSGVGTLLYSFTGLNNSNDGGFPYGKLIQGNDGNLYGMTFGGGTQGLGTIFKITTSGVMSVLHSFSGGANDGANPFGGLIKGSDGNFYTLTFKGGSQDQGTVLKVTTTGLTTVLYSFGSNANDGTYPKGNLLQCSDGSFYGLTSSGGSQGLGTAFKITTSGALTILHSFGSNTNDGASPTGTLIQGTDGNLYGTTSAGGNAGWGTVFKMSTDGDETILYMFSPGPYDGRVPSGDILQASDGSLYGMTSNGGVYGYGSVFKISLQ